MRFADVAELVHAPPQWAFPREGTGSTPVVGITHVFGVTGKFRGHYTWKFRGRDSGDTILNSPPPNSKNTFPNSPSRLRATHPRRSRCPRLLGRWSNGTYQKRIIDKPSQSRYDPRLWTTHSPPPPLNRLSFWMRMSKILMLMIGCLCSRSGGRMGGRRRSSAGLSRRWRMRCSAQTYWMAACPIGAKAQPEAG